MVSEEKLFENVDGQTDAGDNGILIAHLGAFGELTSMNSCNCLINNSQESSQISTQKTEVLLLLMLEVCFSSGIWKG